MQETKEILREVLSKRRQERITSGHEGREGPNGDGSTNAPSVGAGEKAQVMGTGWVKLGVLSEGRYGSSYVIVSLFLINLQIKAIS